MTSDDDHLLLTTVLADGPAVTESWSAWCAGADLRDISPDAHRLLPLASRNVRRVAPGTPIPDRVRGLERHSWVRNQLARRECGPVLEELTRRGIPTMLLKGASLAPHYGDEWMHRVMYDFDVLVRPRDSSDALACFAELGWRPDLDLSPASIRSRMLVRRHSWGMRSSRGAELDLHWHVLIDSLGARADESFWAGSVESSDLGVESRRMGDADLLFHVVRHGELGEPGSGLQWLVDATMILRSVDASVIARRVAEQARAHDVLEDTMSALEQLRDQVDPPGVEHLMLAGQRLRPRRRERRLAQARAEQTEPTRRDVIGFTMLRHGGGRTRFGSRARGAWTEHVESALTRAPRRYRVYASLGRSRRLGRVLFGRRPVSRPPDGATPRDLLLGATLDAHDPAVIASHGGPGWSYTEPDGTATDGAEARLVVTLREAPSHDLWLDLDFWPVVVPQRPRLRVDVLVNGSRLARWAFDLATLSPGPYGVRVPQSLACDATLEVTLRIDRPCPPLLFGLNPDRRRLGVKLKSVRIIDASRAVNTREV